MNTSTNPSALQSKTWIMNSLIKLMETTDYKNITITDIANDAGIVRRTFYRHFDSKEDVLSSYFNIMVAEFTNKLSEYISFNCKISLRELFIICKKHKRFFNSLKHNNMLGLLLEQWNILLPNIHNQMLPKITNFPETKDTKSLEYLLTFNVGGTFNIIIKWINEDMEMSPDELADIIEEFAGGSLFVDN